MATVELNDAELALIEAERKRKAAEDEEKVAKLKVENAKKIAEMKKEIERYVTSAQAENQALNNLYGDLCAFDSRWSRTIVKEPKTFKAERGYPTELLASETVEVERIHVRFTWTADKVVEVEVEQYGNEFKFRTNNHAITDYGKSFKTARKLHEKIFNYFDEIDRKKIAQANALSLQDEAINLLQEMFPNTKISKTSTYVPDHSSRYYARSGRYANSIEQQLVLVEFQNGVKVVYTFSKKTTDDKVSVKIKSVNYSSVDFTEFQALEMILNSVKDLPKRV